MYKIYLKTKKHKTFSQITAENVGWSTTLLQCLFLTFWTAAQRTLRSHQLLLKIEYHPFQTISDTHDLQQQILHHQEAESTFTLRFLLNLFYTNALTGSQLSYGFAPSRTSCFLDQLPSPAFFHIHTQEHSTLSIYMKLNFYPTVVCGNVNVI